MKKWSIVGSKNPNYKHGGKGTRLYEIWQGMKKRCFNPKSKMFYCYGARGIIVCTDWLDFTVFKTWALDNGYTDNLTIERDNVNGNYEPSNCIWIPFEKQASNTRRSRVIEHGNEKMTLAQFCRKHNKNPTWVTRQLDNNKSIDYILNNNPVVGRNQFSK